MSEDNQKVDPEELPEDILESHVRFYAAFVESQSELKAYKVIYPDCSDFKARSDGPLLLASTPVQYLTLRDRVRELEADLVAQKAVNSAEMGDHQALVGSGLAKVKRILDNPNASDAASLKAVEALPRLYKMLEDQSPDTTLTEECLSFLRDIGVAIPRLAA